jgi:poly-beta-1,6-N-acetyl-D-glucosamine synthase
MTEPRTPVVAIVPARDEPAIAATVASLRAQTRPPELIVVVANNCTDDTAGRARAAGAYVMDLPVLAGRKAGAINAALDGLDDLDFLDDAAVVVVVDADSVLDPRWIERALPLLPAYGAASGSFETIRRPGLLALLQRTEYAQARHRTDQLGGAVNVLSGAASMTSMGLLRRIRHSRGRRHPLPGAGWGRLPGPPGTCYNPHSNTEDFEITLAAKALGARPVSPDALRVHTDTMRTVGSLWQQRLRWQRGWLADSAAYPWAQTWRGWLTQAWLHGSALAAPLLAVLLTAAIVTGTFTWQPWWLALVPLISGAEMWSARRAGAAGIVLAGLVAPMWLYAVWRTVVCYAALAHTVRSTAPAWH